MRRQFGQVFDNANGAATEPLTKSSRPPFMRNCSSMPRSDKQGLIARCPIPAPRNEIGSGVPFAGTDRRGGLLAWRRRRIMAQPLSRLRLVHAVVGTVLTIVLVSTA